MDQLKQIVIKHLSHVIIDKDWVKNFDDWYRGLVNKNENHVKFFGSLLLGVYDIKFEAGDFNYIWDVLLEAERDVLQAELSNVEVINPDWHVVTNIDNHAFIFMCHLVATSKLADNLKRAIITRILIVFQFKFITSRHFNDWPYLANKEIALATYDSLSGQFKLKQFSSWTEYLNSRSTEIYLGGERRKDFLTIINKFDDDTEIIHVISGVSTNIGKIINRWNKVYYQMHESGTKLSLTSSLGSDGEGGSIVKDLDGIARHRLYAESNLGNASKFIDHELIDVVAKTARLKRSDFVTTLTYISNNYAIDNETGKFAIGALNYGLNRLLDERKSLKDIAGAYRYLANAYGNNRSTSPTLDNIRTRGEAILKASKYNNPKSSVITVIATYIVIWCLRGR